MAITSIGYDGTVDEVQAAKLFTRQGLSDYGVVGVNDWKVTAHPSIAQALNIEPGTGWGPGVLDTSDSIVTVQCDPISSGTRWDLIVLHRDWQPLAGASTFKKINGGASNNLPVRDTNPGVVDDQPIYIVEWTAGQTQPTTIVDLRCWASNGGAEIASESALDYLAKPGSAVMLNGDVLRYRRDSNGVWGWKVMTDDDGTMYQMLAPAGNYTFSGGCNIKSQKSDGRTRVDVVATMKRTTSDNPISATVQDLGAVLPSLARGSADSTVLACPVGGVPAQVFVRLEPSSGKLYLWTNQNFTWTPGQFISLNCTYFL